MPLINDDGSPFNPLATVGKPEGLIVTRDQFSPPIREGGPIQSDPMGQRGTPSFTDTLGASFRLENEVVGAVRALTRDRDFGDEDPEHNPWDTIKDTKYQDYWQAFTSSRNSAETESIRARIDQELEDRRIREASGLTGFLTDMAASIASPTILLPGGAIYRGFRASGAAARSAAAVGTAAAGGVAVQEAMLQQQQLTRTWQESMLNIGGATVLGGLLGGGASYFSSRALSRAARQIDDDIVRLRTETADISAMTSRVDPQSVGAATSRTVQENIPASAYGLEQVFSFQGPLTRTLASEIRSARDVMTRLAEIPYKLRQNKEGIPTGPAGGSVEGRIKTEGDVALYRASESLHKGFAEYRYGNADAKFAKSRAAFNDMLKPAQGRMNWRDYKSEITKALRSETGKGIEHPIPQVKAAAEAFRKEVFEPFKKEAQKLGLFPEDAEFSFNYVMRRYDINAILNDYARFKQILVDHLKGGQAKARAELAKIEREIAASRAGGDMSGDVDALAKQFEAERARVQEARSAQSNIKESMDADREYLDALIGLRDDAPRFADPISGLPISRAEIDSIVDMWSFVQETKKAKQPQSLIDFLRGRGGLLDQGKEISTIIDGARSRPGLISKSGMNLDDAALASWEAGFVTGADRPTIADFLEAIREDISGNRVVRAADQSIMDDLRIAREMESELDQLGLGKAKSAEDIEKHFRAPEGGSGAAGRAAALGGAQREILDAERLDMSHAARMARAKEMGFDTSKVWYHGTKKDFSEFTLPGGRKQAGNYRDGPGEADVAIFLSSDPKVASGYASAGSNKGEGSRVIPAYIRMQNPREINLKGELYRDENAELIESSIKRGHDGIIYTYPDGVKEAVVFDPANIRSVNAAFNPQQSGSAKLIDDPVVRILDAERLDVETRIADEKAAERRIRAFHGSPHEFDKFTVEAIGSGEGAQAFGHGLYFAEKEGVARWYSENLADVNYASATDEFLAKNTGGIFGLSAKDALYLKDAAARADDQGWSIGYIVDLDVENKFGDVAATPSSSSRVQKAAKTIDETAKPKGHLYEVSIKADPDRMLDWDKPLSEQSESVTRVLEDRATAAIASDDPQMRNIGKDIIVALRGGNVTGEGAIRSLERLTGAKDSASGVLRELGIPGIRYLDRNSRGTGEGSRNIVVFDDSLVEIVSRDGVPVNKQDQAAVKEEMAAPRAEPQPEAEAPSIELDPAVISAVEGMAARLGIQMPDLRGLDLDAMMEAVTRAIGDMTGMSQQGGKSSADMKALMSRRDELRYIADASDDELGSIAADTISTITGSPAARGVNPYSAELLEGTSGPLKARTLKIPDDKIVDFLDDDIERIAQQYVRAMAPDVAIVREFGDLNLTEDLKRIQDEANAKMDANPERAAELQAQSVRAQKDLQAVVARLRGTYNIAHDPVSYGPRAAQVAKQANVLRLMGAVLASSISDVPKLLFVHGFRQNADLFGTMISNLGNLKMAKAEAKELSAGLEFVLSRSGQMWDAFEDMAGHTFGERALRVATNKMGRLTLMDQWNATFKQLSGIMTMNRVLRASVDLVNGRIKPKELEKLAASGIGDEMAERIAAQYQKHGTVYGRLFLPNANEWDDSLARQALSSAVRREADLTITTPGQERPLWTSGTYGSVVGQFRTFQMVSIQRTLIAGLQDMDAAKVSAMAMMISLGMLSEQLKSIIHGKDGKNLPKDMGDWMYVGMANSGILGWLTDADQMAHKVSRGNISLGKFAFGRDAPTARFASQNAIGSLLGPTYGAGADIIQAIGAASAGEVRESDIHAMRRLMPYQNLFYISRALRAFEEGMIDAAGVPRTQRRN